MSIRLRYSTAVRVSSDSTLESKDLGNLSYESVTDALGEGGSRKFTLAAGATTVSLCMGNVAQASFIFIKTSAKNPLETPGMVKFRLQTSQGTEDVSVTPLAATGQGQLLLTGSVVTSLSATNPSAVDMDIVLVVAGD